MVAKHPTPAPCGAGRGPGSGSCAPPRASPGSAAPPLGAVPLPPRRSPAGSRKASTRPSSSRRKRRSTNWRELAIRLRMCRNSVRMSASQSRRRPVGAVMTGSFGSSPAAYPQWDERRESARKPGVQGDRGELAGGVEMRPSRSTGFVMPRSQSGHSLRHDTRHCAYFSAAAGRPKGRGISSTISGGRSLAAVPPLQEDPCRTFGFWTMSGWCPALTR